MQTGERLDRPNKPSGTVNAAHDQKKNAHETGTQTPTTRTSRGSASGAAAHLEAARPSSLRTQFWQSELNSRSDERQNKPTPVHSTLRTRSHFPQSQATKASN
jgi:hypothetical protein